MLQSVERQVRRKSPAGRDRFEDEAHFLRSWIERPLMTGAVIPSGKVLARTMASYIDPRTPGPIVELGPGTGPVTGALVRRGIAQDRLVLVEFNPEFCKLLRRRFPKATIVQGDAYDIEETLKGVVDEPVAGVISSLPLLTKPLEQRLQLLKASQNVMRPGAPFVQFTYAVVPPMPVRSADYTASRSQRVWLNLPPACVWVYRHH